MTFDRIMYIITLVASGGMIIFACLTFYRWRPSGFADTTGYLRNLRHIPDGEKADIRVVSPNGVFYCRSGKRHKPLIYYEIAYRVNGTEYFIYEFNEDDNTAEPLPVRWKIHYKRTDPKLAYRGGAMREGVVLAWVLTFLGTAFFLMALAALLS